MDAAAEDPAAGGSSAMLRSLRRKLLGDSAGYALARMIPQGAGLVLLGLYTRLLGPDAYGRVSFAETVGSLIATIITLGVPGAIQPYFFDKKLPRGPIVGTVFWMVVALLGLGAVVGVGVALVAPALVEDLSVGTPELLAAIGTMLLMRWQKAVLGLQRAARQVKEFVALSLGQFVATTIFVLLILITVQSTAFGMLLGRFGGALVASLAGLWMVRGWLREPTLPAERAQVMRFSVPLVAHAMVALLLTAGDRFVLERLASDQAMGEYALAYTLGSTMTVVNNITLLAYAPFFYKLHAEGESGMSRIGFLGTLILAAMSFALLAGNAIALPFVRWYMDVRYAASAPLVPIILTGTFIHGIFGLLHLHLMARRRTAMMVAYTVAAAILNLGLNLWWVPTYGPTGAAWATLAAYALEAILMLVAALRLEPLPYPWLRWGALLLGLIPGFVVTQLPEAGVPASLGAVAIGLLPIALAVRVRR